MLRSHSSADWIWRSPTSPQPSHFRGVLPASPCATAILFHAGRFGFWVGALGLNFAPALVFFGWRAFRAGAPVAVVASLTLTSHAGRGFFRSSYWRSAAITSRSQFTLALALRVGVSLVHSRCCDTRAVTLALSLAHASCSSFGNLPRVRGCRLSLSCLLAPLRQLFRGLHACARTVRWHALLRSRCCDTRALHTSRLPWYSVSLLGARTARWRALRLAALWLSCARWRTSRLPRFLSSSAPLALATHGRPQSLL